jgi:MFS family permease
LLPKSGMNGSPANVGLVGSTLFALFLVGWGMAFIWGPIADRFGRARVLAASVLVYAVFTGDAALSQNVWQLGLFRLLAGIGIGANGRWLEPISRRPGLKIAARWARAICRPATTPGAVSPPR